MRQFDEYERARVGDQAELLVRQIISSHGEGALLRGPLIPSMNLHNQIEGYRETDFLVYTQGTVFCIEVKNYSGTITYLPLYHSQQSLHGQYHAQQNIFSGYDDSKILQIKQRKSGEPPVRETYPNPLKKTKQFILQLKKYVGRIEPRFQHLFIIPVVCFGNKANISAIYDFEKGMISIDQLPAFLDEHRNPQFAQNPSSWITETILNKIPNWDRIQTVGGEWLNGILVEPRLTFTGPDGLRYSLSDYSIIKSISWQRMYNARHLQMTVAYTNGSTQIISCSDGQISLIRGKRPETYPVHDLQYLIVGLANNLVYR